MKKRKMSSFRALAGVIPLAGKQAPFEVVFLGILTVALSVKSGLIVYVNQFFYDGVIGAVTGRNEVSLAVMGAAAVVGLILIEKILGEANNCVWEDVRNKLQYGLLAAFDKKAARIPAQKFEDPEFLDEIEKASDGVYGALGMFIVAFDTLIYEVGYFIIMGFYLWHIRPVLLLALVLVFVPEAIVTAFQSEMYAEQADELAPLRRRADSYYDAAVNPRETRLFGIFGYFHKLVSDRQRDIFKRRLETEKRKCRMNLAMNLCKALGWCGIAVLMMAELSRGNITIGAFAAVYASMKKMFEECEILLFRIRVDIAENLGMIEDYLNFVNTPAAGGDASEPDFGKGIQVGEVCFRYPGTEQNAVDGVTFTVAPGETVAIVGENGSGKTTLAKLLCGLYLPDTGNVLIGGVNSAKAHGKTLFSRSTAVFQNYVRYGALSLQDNVRLGDTDREEEAEKYLEAVGADFVTDLENACDTILSREFDGTELSGGQWQRVAMARGLYRSHELIILDEPTAAIDPLEETRIYKMFAEYTKGKIGILITHRLGSARIADRILVMDKGKITESGSHEELLHAGGHYADMWKAAAEGYSE